MNIFEFQDECTCRQSLSVNLPFLVPKLIVDTVIKFHQVHIWSKSVLSQMQHLQHNLKLKLTIDLTLNYEKIFEFQNGSTKKTNLQIKFIVKCSASVPKVTTKSMFAIKFNFE